MLSRFIALIGFTSLVSIGCWPENPEDSSFDFKNPPLNVPVPFDDDETNDNLLPDDDGIIFSELSQDNLLVNS